MARGPPEARGPMQLHRLHRLKAGPGGTAYSGIRHVYFYPVWKEAWANL